VIGGGAGYHAAMDGRVHHEVLTAFVRRGRPPALDELARALAVAPEDVAAALRRLHDGHGLVLHPGSTDVWITHPVSASPTAVWVADGARGWWAPCLWCASGIVALAAPTSTIHARYAGEHEPAAIEVRGGVAAGDLVVHFSLPPRDAWCNVVHWCSTVLPFRRAADVAPWCDRHGLPLGAVVPWTQVLAFGRAWYGRHLDQDWRKHTVTEAQAIFDALGLRGDFWRLPASDRPF
jgi:hypothetical protein